MFILIAKQHEGFFKETIPQKKLNVVGQTEHTLTVRISKNKFNSLYQKIVQGGNNPFALMSW